MPNRLQLKEGWIAVFCFFLMLLSVTWSIQAAEWAAGISILQTVVLGASILGIVLAKSRAPNRMAHLLSLLAGITWTTLLASRVLASAMILPLPAAVQELEWRIMDFFVILFRGSGRADNIIFLLILSLLLWLVAYFCAWAVFRWQRVWWAIIVSGAALMININYAKTNLNGFLIGFLLFALLLVVRTSLASYEQEWQRAGVGYSSELVYSFLRAGLVISVLAIILAWLTPEALASRHLRKAWDQVGKPWQSLQDRSSDIFQDLNYQNEAQLYYSDRWMKFGGPVELPDTPVMDIRASTGRFWRVMVFHEYVSDGWSNTDIDSVFLAESEQELVVPELELRREITQTIQMHRDLNATGAIIAAGQPLRVALPSRAVVSYVTREEKEVEPSLNKEEAPALPGDPSVLYTRQTVKAGESYQAVSSLSRADEESLDQAGTDYPDWVTPRYLQLPESLPTRVQLLAEQITTEHKTPYAKAKAIETYLREIPYNEKIEGPLPGQDGVDYFLFTAKEGYCDYYSSAMVVMLRAVDIPARYVRGYSQRTKVDGAFHILESNAHAWPEVFFPGYGWIEFEPTGGEPPLNRPRSQNPTNSGGTGGPDPRRPERDWEGLIEDDMFPEEFESGSTASQWPDWQQTRPWVAFCLLLIAFLLGIVLLSARRQRHLQGLSIAERVYVDLVQWVQRLFRISPLAHQTPHEYAQTVNQTVPKGSQAVERITGFYVKERFGNKEVSRAEADLAWGQAQSAMRHRWVERKVDRVRRIWWRFVPPKELELPPDQQI